MAALPLSAALLFWLFLLPGIATGSSQRCATERDCIDCKVTRPFDKEVYTMIQPRRMADTRQ